MAMHCFDDTMKLLEIRLVISLQVHLLNHRRWRLLWHTSQTFSSKHRCCLVCHGSLSLFGIVSEMFGQIGRVQSVFDEVLFRLPGFQMDNYHSHMPGIRR